MVRRLYALILLLPISACASLERSFLPDPVLLDSHWERSGTGAGAVDHAPWTAFLDRYLAPDLSGVNRVHYAAVTEADRALLDSYIAALEATAASRLGRDEQLAFWVNLYNAKTVSLILAHYPVGSIRDLSEGPFDPGPWDEKRLTVEGRALSLDDIEHRIIRPLWRDPRIHYVLNCAAVGCPNLAPTAYRGHDIDRRMSAAARAYVNDRRGVHIEPDGDLVASKIYSWFREDFGGSEEAVLGHIRRYAARRLFERLEGRKRIDAYRYDWSLNDRQGASAGRSPRASE